ncbi:unnamed protein product [Victoria cruziana]
MKNRKKNSICCFLNCSSFNSCFLLSLWPKQDLSLVPCV